MPRGLIRIQHAGQFHFITFSCYQRQPLLARGKGYSVFEHELESTRLKYGFVVLGYVLMPEHVHLLLNEPPISSLATILQVLKQQTGKALKHPSEAQFWQRRYYDFNVWTEKKTSEKLHYMHQNPVRRGLVARPEEWPWSSFRHQASGEKGTVEIESRWTAQGRQLKAIQVSSASAQPTLAANNATRMGHPHS